MNGECCLFLWYVFSRPAWRALRVSFDPTGYCAARFMTRQDGIITSRENDTPENDTSENHIPENHVPENHAPKKNHIQKIMSQKITSQKNISQKNISGKSPAIGTPIIRKASIKRRTAETDISATIAIEGRGVANIGTGIGFLDHMLEQIARHSLMDIQLDARGDLNVDDHHTTEDSGIVLGQALDKALGERRGITRFGQALSPMDESLSRVSIDCSGRPFLVWDVPMKRDKIGTMDSELFREWFRAFAEHGRLTLHVSGLYGDNSHHMIESCFKGLARALRQAVSMDPGRGGDIPSTKGML